MGFKTLLQNISQSFLATFTIKELHVFIESKFSQQKYHGSFSLALLWYFPKKPRIESSEKSRSGHSTVLNRAAPAAEYAHVDAGIGKRHVKIIRNSNNITYYNQPKVKCAKKKKSDFFFSSKCIHLHFCVFSVKTFGICDSLFG